MKFNKLSYLAVLTGGHLASGQEVHGEGAEGTEMGPVAFLWPADRPWSAESDNIAPCGSASGPANRTDFPLSQGSVSLSIADDAWNVAFSIAYDNDPTAQSDFTQQVVDNITAIEAGHQCYKVADIPDTVGPGTNATIQLEYWSSMDDELGGRNQSFYACADVTFVEPEDFDIQVPCFNVKASEFNLPEDEEDEDSASTTPSAASEVNAENSGDFGSGLASGAKAGIAVGVIVASLAIVGAVAFLVLRKRKLAPVDQERAIPASKGMAEVASVNSRN
ncbi:hypothetical protein DL764_004395 [Monosporascus ibericus]|uniref:Copper acquisition factor BIM1-like domain-containing protein n=1 Tax=Monosporascus ibericus TaxID=155417 RepID=A0A4Q4TGV6_9PEZI|nr:hypothetical protein DL764_004395 [Monosporascus ibericus]